MFRGKKPSLLIIFLSVFIDLVGFGIVMPLLPIYSKNFGAGGFMIGFIIASFSAMQFLFAPAWGRLSDRIGRRPVILISNAGSAIAYALFGVASTMTHESGLWLLLGSRIFAGICGANLSVASAYIADISPPEKRTARMGLIGMAFGLGFIFGPAFGAFSLKLGLAGPGWVAGGLCAFNFLLGCFILAESRKPTSEHVAPRPKFAQWGHVLRQPKIRLLVVLYFFATFCFAAFESTFSLLVKEKYQMDAEHAGYLFTYCGVMAALLQGGLVGRLNKRFGEQKLIFSSLLITGLGLLLLPAMNHLAGLLVALAMFAIGSGINRPPTFGLISLLTGPDEQGATLGVAQSASSLARILSPLFANLIYAVHPSMPYFISAGIAFLAGLAAWIYLCGGNQTALGARMKRDAGPTVG